MRYDSVWVRALVMTIGCALAVAGAAQAESLFDKVKKGAEDLGRVVEDGVTQAGKAIDQGAQAAGEALARGSDAVEDGAGRISDAAAEEFAATAQLFDADATPEEMRDQLDTMAETALDQLWQEQPDAELLLEKAAGYAVFDMRRVTVLGLTGGGGRGVALAAKTATRTYMNMATGGVGLGFGIGGFNSKLVILFQTTKSFDEFIRHGLDATAQGAAHAGDDGGDTLARFEDGRAVFVLTRDGWRISATMSGTKYWPDDRLN